MLLSLTIWAEVLPKTPKCIDYKTIQSVLTKGWKYSDENLTNWIEKDGKNFLQNFKKMVKIPLKSLSDKEYLEKEMNSYELTKKTLQNFSYSIRSKVDYKKRYKQQIKHGIYFDNYINRASPEIYRYALIVIKYLENQQKYLKSSELYILLMERLINDIKIHGKSFFETVVWRVKEEDLFISLKSSLQNDKYTKEQKEEFLKYLSKLLQINESIFIETMQHERKFILSYLYIEFIENLSFEDYVKYDAKSTINAMKCINYEMLKRYFEDKDLMQRLIDRYMQKYDVIFHKLLNMEDEEVLESYVDNMPGFEDFLSLSDMTRLLVLYGLDKIELSSLSKVFQYEFNEKEFVEVASQFFITSGKPWVFGKYKFEWEKIIKQNEELLNQ